jgi:hypothetical protein
MSNKFVRFEIDLNAKCVCGCMEGDRVHKIYRFPNDYGASVVSGRKVDGKVGQYRMFVLHFESPAPEHCWEISSDNPVSGGADTLELRDWVEVEAVLERIFALPN